MREFLRKEVDGWDDPVKATAWFKGFSGQRRDWEGRYLFWRNLILKVARHLGTSIIRPSRLKNIWFCKDGAVSPLCLDRVLVSPSPQDRYPYSMLFFFKILRLALTGLPFFNLTFIFSLKCIMPETCCGVVILWTQGVGDYLSFFGKQSR